MSGRQYGRKAELLLRRPGQSGNNPSAFVPEKTLRLSEFHFTFQTAQQDVEAPNNCAIRVFNLARETVDSLTRFEYSDVIVQAGYEDSFGVVFQGTIKQFKVGREDATTTYVDILAADGDVAYNYSVVNKTLAAGSTSDDRVKAAIQAMAPHGVSAGHIAPSTGGILPRGKVLFGMARAVLRDEARLQGATWSIDGNSVNIIPLDGYLPGDIVELSALTGMVGMPEQTENGLRVRTLLNPRIQVGGLVRINNKSVNQTINQQGAAPIAYNSYVGVQLLANITNDGIYRVYVAEFTGDTRGQAWYTDLVCLAVDSSTNKVQVP